MDPHPFDADPDSTTSQNVYLSFCIKLHYIQTIFRYVLGHHFDADPDADPDPTFHLDADPDPNPSFKKRLHPLKKY